MNRWSRDKGLSPHQQAALAKAAPAQKAAIRAGFEKQNKTKERGKASPPAQRAAAPANALQTFAQGAAAVTKKAFGSVRSYSLRCWDATKPEHLPLPRAVGPYTVIRTTRRFNTSGNNMIFGTFRHATNSTLAGVANHWTNIAAVEDVSAAGGIGATTNCQRFCFDFSALGSQATLVPAALTVQIVNPNALTTTSGVVYAGVMPTQAAFGGSADSWTTVFDRFVQTQAPRMMMAGKLALRGIQINSYPLNMTALADFISSDKLTDGTFTWSTGFDPVGLAPILVYNPNGISLEYLVTVEWRVRFDLANPASAGHTHHAAAPDHVWDRLMEHASKLGNGAMDIADVVANTGQFADKVMSVLSV